jgi:hypothetical protein
MADKAINLLEDIQKGLSPSYLGQFNSIINLNTSEVPGAVFTSKKLQVQTPRTITGDYKTYSAIQIGVSTSTDQITLVGLVAWSDIYRIGQSVRFTTTGSLPGGLSTNTTYYVVEGSGDKIKVASSLANYYAGTVVDITSDGTGTHTVTAETVSALIQIQPTGITRFTHVGVEDSNYVWLYDSTYNSWLRVTGHVAGGIGGVAVWKGYIILIHATRMDAFGPLTSDLSTAAWTNYFHSGGGEYQTSTYKPNVVLANDILYVGNKNLVTSLMEVAGQTFAPGTAGTFTYTANALDLPTQETIYSLDALGTRLSIGTGSDIGRIYFWDTFSPSFDLPIVTPCLMVAVTISINNILYFIDNYRGTIYATNGTGVSTVGQLPYSSISGQQVGYDNIVGMSLYGNSIMRLGNKILFGVGFPVTRPGIYSFDLDSSAIALEYTVNSGFTATENQTVNINAMASLSANFFFVSIYDGTQTSGYRYQLQTTTLGGVLRSEGFFETGLMLVGTKDQPKNYRFFNITLAKELAAGDAITLYYRNNLTDAYTTVGTMSYASDGAVHSKRLENSAVRGDQIQFKCVISCSSTAQLSPELRAIYLE